MPSTTWTGLAGDADFGTPGNWDNGLPDGSVDAAIAGTQAAPITVKVDTGLDYTAATLTTTDTTLGLGAGMLTIDRASSLDALTETGGELVVNATDTAASVTSLTGPVNVAISATLDVAHGTLALSGTDTLAGRVTGDGTLRTEGTAEVADLSLADGVTLDNTGTETLSEGLGSGLNGDLLDNEAGAIFDITSAASDQLIFDSGIDNAGLFERTGQTTTSFVYASTTNTGIVASSGGALAFMRDFTNSGTVAGAGTVDFTGATTFLAGTSLSVAHMGFDSDATMELGTDLSYGGSLSMTQGSVIALNGHTLTFSGGTGDSFATLATGGGTLLMTGNAAVDNLMIDNGTELDNRGTVSVDADNLVLGDFHAGTAFLFNEAGATFDLMDGGGVYAFQESYKISDGSISNAGLFAKTDAAAASYINAGFDNEGTVTVAGGKLFFFGGLTNSGSITGAGTVQCEGLQLEAGSVLTVAGITITDNVDVSADASYAGALDAIGQTYVQISDNVTLTLTGNARDVLDMTVFTGRLVTDGTTPVDYLTMNSGTVLDNRGIETLRNADLTLGDAAYSSATVDNESGATIDLLSDVSIQGFGGSLIRNTGLIEKTGGTGVSEINAAIDNKGTVEVQTGTLDLAGTLWGKGTLQVDAGASLELGTATGETVRFGSRGARLAIDTHASYTGIIQGLAVGDAIRLGDVAATSVVSAKIDGSSLDIVLNDASTITYALSAPMPDVIVAHGADAAGGTDFTIEEAPCFLTGTRILTTRGEIPVEHLRAGDHVLTAEGRAAPVRWVGCRRFDLTTIRDPARFRPIRIRRDAIAPGVPKRDLLVSRGHAIRLANVLVPALYLANGASIVEDRGFDAVTYWHVELDRHDVLIAEGLTAESYLDTGNRHLFETGHALAERVADAGSCLPVVNAGETLAHIRAGIAARIGLGHTQEPDLHLLADGVAVAARRGAGGVYRFVLSEAPGRLHLISRANIAPRIGVVPDMRMFGVAVTAIVLRAPGITRALDLTDPALAGFSWPECGADGTPFRWTDGDAVLPPALWAGVTAFMLDVSVSATVPYWTETKALAMAG